MATDPSSSAATHADVFVLCRQRDAAAVTGFRSAWVGAMAEVVPEYEFPQNAASPDTVYPDPWALCGRLLRQSDQPYAIRWIAAGEGLVRHATLVFTADSEMVGGLTLASWRIVDLRRYLQELASSVDGAYGYVTHGDPPAATRKAFIGRAKASTAVRLVAGVLHG